MHGLASTILATIGDTLPPTLRLLVMPWWKVEILAEGGHLTIGEIRILAAHVERVSRMSEAA